MTYEKTITYERGDYRMELDGRCVGFRATYGQADYALDEMIFDALIYGVTYDPPAPAPDPDPLPDPGPGGPGVPGDERP